MAGASERFLLRLSLIRGQHSRVAVFRDDAYTRSYRMIRLAVGVVGVVLPLILIVGEAYYLRGGVQVRGSLSAYYHTNMQDVFVGGLCIIGFLLATYLAGEPRTTDFAISLVAGIALLGVVFFPAVRPELPVDAAPCESGPSIAGCSWTEYIIGERPTAIVHFVMAVVFILCLAGMSLLFAASTLEVAGCDDDVEPTVRIADGRVFWPHLACAAAILLFGAWAFLGVQFWIVTSLYLGEIGAVWAFAISWIMAGLEVTAPKRPVPSATLARAS